ncbi:S8 family serine peptidase [Halalkalibacter akibai]|uniref:Extracellular serine protease n=1 Tax=Halalkalibacter akibai (strain ATCC 43226 / DSM 21942 / CIP 109018 / JCM 9157 / 1139) TaxID=1236973 RepID=W4QQZ0_HALA3|nr:S8 family serine peptidase [Halalkalibacter akibai]GAE34510.1 extracellular serine protease [Halalkalibacter akibai JCM 9157]
MRKKFNLFVIYSLIVMLTVSSFGFSASANQTGTNLATLHLEVDELSTKLVTVIVELDEESIVEAKHQGKNQTKANLEAERTAVIEAVEKAVPTADVNFEYEYVFSGFSVELAENDIASLAAVPGVKAVYANETYEVSSIEEAELLDPETFTPLMADSAPFIQSDEAWAEGFTGEGVTVAILDTGVDYTHPDLEHAFGEYLGWDFVDNDADPQETPIGDPRGASTNHGTHVAGTVAANGAIKGVAPDATLLAYRVLGPGGRGATQGIIAAIDRAVQDGADVMNLSLGASVNNPDYATSLALDRAMADGVVAVTSNGNSGPNNWTVGSPGTSREAISVGATTLPFNLYSSTITTAGDVEFPSAKVMGYPSDEAIEALDGKEYEFVHVGLGARANYENVDVKGKVALVSRGDFSFTDKAIFAKEKGAVAVILYNNTAGEQPDIPGMELPTIKTTQADGRKLITELEAGNNTISFNVEFVERLGETMASFSSRGPVMDTWMIKPDVSAPGVAIVSTVPTHNPANPHGYASNQGTSMSAPHVAGAAALILEAHPDWSVDFVKAALMNTAENMIDPATGEYYAHNSQGAGSIRVMDAINTEVLVTPGSHSFGIFTNEDEKEVRRQSFTIHNLSDQRKRYSIEFTGHEGIKVQTSNNLQVQPGKTQNLNFGVQVDVAKLEPGYYEGTFLIKDGTKTIEVPTILFVQEPDYPFLTGLSLALSGGNLIGQVNVRGGAEEFNLRIRNADTNVLLAEPAKATNVASGIHSFSWDMTIDGQPLTPGRYQINAYAKRFGHEVEVTGGVLTINPNEEN